MPDMEFWHLLCIPSVRSSGIFLLFPNEEVPFTIPHKRKPKGMFNGGEDRWSGQAVLVLWIQDMAISGEVSRIFSLWGFMKETCTLETTENVPVFRFSLSAERKQKHTSLISRSDYPISWYPGVFGRLFTHSSPTNPKLSLQSPENKV